MNVADLRDKLLRYNPEANVRVIVDNQSQPFSLTYGGGDGVRPENCESIGFYVDGMCSNETRNPTLTDSDESTTERNR